MAEKELKMDWVYLPESLEEVSLWACLHDGELISSESNLSERFVELEFSVKHLLEEQEREEKIRFLMKVADVTSVRAIGHFRPIDKYEEPLNISVGERAQLTKEYYAKWREESLGWSEFESALATDPLGITDAAFVSNNDETTLRLGGFLDGEKFDDIFFDVFIRGRRISATRSDGRDFSLDAFIKLGTDYWNHFGNRN